MSCLTKKSLIFMVLSIVCNPVFSVGTPEHEEDKHLLADMQEEFFEADMQEEFFEADMQEEFFEADMQEEFVEDSSDDCIANVHLVFDNSILPKFAFKFAMWSLSEKLIRSLTNTSQLVNHLRHQENEFLQSDDDFKDQHKDIGDYLRFLIVRFNHQNDTSLESKKQDNIIGYFKYLVHKFDKFSDYIHYYAEFPMVFCDEMFGNIKKMCIRALNMMLKDLGDIKEVKLDKAFIYCYLNYSSNDFTKNENNFFSLASSRTNTTPNKTTQDFLLSHMSYFFRNLMNAADGIVLNHSDSLLFPTVEEYCGRDRSSN